MRGRVRSAGFTLLEVMVALAITGIALAALIAATGVGIGNARLSAEYIEATHLAQSRLASVGVASPLAPGEWSGADADGFRWDIRIGPPRERAVVAIYPVYVTIMWLSGGATKSVSISTERLGAASQAG